MRLTLTHKVVFSLFASMLLTSIITLAVGIHCMTKPLDESVAGNLTRVQCNVDAVNTTSARHFRDMGLALAEDGEVQHAVAAGDSEKLRTRLAHFAQETKINVITLTDARARSFRAGRRQ